MVAGADGDAVAVEDLGDVVAVDPVEVEREDSAAVIAGGRAEEREAVDLAEPVDRVGRQLDLGGVDRVEPERVDPANRSAEADRLGDRRGAALEAGRRVRPR